MSNSNFIFIIQAHNVNYNSIENKIHGYQVFDPIDGLI